MIDNIIFDLGQVLIKVNLPTFVEQFRREFQFTDKEMEHQIGDGAYESFMIGKITPAQFHQLTCQYYQRNVSFEKFNAIWNSMLAGPVEGMAEIVEQLKKQNFVLSLLSNTDPWHFEACVQQLPWLSNFSRKFLSYELQMKKPDAEIYLTVAQLLKVSPEQCLFIDDRLDNILAAQALNFKTIHFSDASNLRHELGQIGISV
ncbi:MAG: HAD family phosphatase [candidate division KSB1 bacterium]|nr:HAD family phosphatase [candidate division KSB1 bacterium]MDZ7318175.1 HAD family phosphatase [candidate division KSB1 bacterium]MDZ7340677.1 HAD family phosphatase [candidate division KSB1 bacterium]